MKKLRTCALTSGVAAPAHATAPNLESARDELENAQSSIQALTENGPITTLQTIAQRFIERAAALSLKGVRRDNAALDYFVGAAAGAELAGNLSLAKQIGVNAAPIVAVRGFIGVNEIARNK